MAEYIEREALINTCKKIIQEHWNETTAPVSWSHAYADFIDDIDNQPTVDVAPVRHGRWYSRGGRFRCSVCDNKAFLKDIGGTGGWSHEYEQQKSPYCPNCGAKMDGCESEEESNDNTRSKSVP